MANLLLRSASSSRSPPALRLNSRTPLSSKMRDVRVTRSKRAALAAEQGVLNRSVLSQEDIMHLILPQLDLPSFVALHGTCREVRDATQAVCEDLISILERAATLYVSPRFAEGLHLLELHNPHICWLLQAPVLAVVAADRYAELIGASYHLLQAHLSRLQKLAVSRSLRRAAAALGSHALGPPRPTDRYKLLHLGVRLGMFTESPTVLQELLSAAEQAVSGLAAMHRSPRDQPPSTAAAHYTIAGFYTYHHRRSDMVDALVKAQDHLAKALVIQTRQLGPLHVATLCSQLVKAQV